MPYYSQDVRSQPISLTASTEAQTYLYFACALVITVLGVYVGGVFATLLYSSGLHYVLFIAEIAIIWTSQSWAKKAPLNFILFFLFPLFSGITVAPFIHSVVLGYSNGPAILINALSATGFMSAAAAVFARTTSLNLGFMGRALFLSILGLFAVGLLQMFVPAMRTPAMELAISGFGIVAMAIYTAYQFQMTRDMGKYGAHPILLALGLYIGIFNLFLYILRFMTVLSGDR